MVDLKTATALGLEVPPTLLLLVLAATITWPEIPLFLPRLISPEFLR